MDPIPLYGVVLGIALACLWAIAGPIESKINQNCSSRCTKIQDDARLKHKDGKWTVDEILALFDVSWQLREIRLSADNDVLRAVWVVFGIIGSSSAGLVLTILQPYLQPYAAPSLYDSLFSLINVIMVATLVIVIPFIYRVTRGALRKRT